jgi:thiol-disulfide isomerase/thioredoxin
MVFITKKPIIAGHVTSKGYEMKIVKKVHSVGNRFVLIFILSLFFPMSANAGDKVLVMFGSKSCVYCKIFNRDVAPGYRRSKTARRAPLRKVDIDRRGTGGYSLRGSITVTPTFVMFKRGREVGRIRGYPGKKNFYSMVHRILKRVK